MIQSQRLQSPLLKKKKNQAGIKAAGRLSPSKCSHGTGAYSVHPWPPFAGIKTSTRRRRSTRLRPPAINPREFNHSSTRRTYTRTSTSIRVSLRRIVAAVARTATTVQSLCSNKLVGSTITSCCNARTQEHAPRVVETCRPNSSIPPSDRPPENEQLASEAPRRTEQTGEEGNKRHMHGGVARQARSNPKNVRK